MKFFISFVFILSFILISGCKSKTPEEKKCDKMMEHMYNLTVDSPKINALPSSERNELIDSLRAEFEAKKTQSIKECSIEFNEKTYNCIMNTNSIQNLSKCD